MQSESEQPYGRPKPVVVGAGATLSPPSAESDALMHNKLSQPYGSDDADEASRRPAIVVAEAPRLP